MTTTITKKLKAVVDKLSKLPAEDQDLYAEYMSEELGSDGDEIWKRLFAETTDEQWKKMVVGVKEEIKAGKVSPLTASDFLID